MSQYKGEVCFCNSDSCKTIKCDHCHISLLLCNYEDHKGICREIKIPCSNGGCNLMIHRRDIRLHLLKCQAYVINVILPIQGKLYGEDGQENVNMSVHRRDYTAFMELIGNECFSDSQTFIQTCPGINCNETLKKLLPENKNGFIRYLKSEKALTASFTDNVTTQTINYNYLENLPAELKIKIFSYLDPISLQLLSKTSRGLNEDINSLCKGNITIDAVWVKENGKWSIKEYIHKFSKVLKVNSWVPSPEKTILSHMEKCLGLHDRVVHNDPKLSVAYRAVTKELFIKNPPKNKYCEQCHISQGICKKRNLMDF